MYEFIAFEKCFDIPLQNSSEHTRHKKSPFSFEKSRKTDFSYVAAGEGFEPSQTESESGTLILEDCKLNMAYIHPLLHQTKKLRFCFFSDIYIHPDDIFCRY